jgi:hypothetical protein
VLDAEAVAIDRKTGKLMPFQELSRRKRKDVKVEDIQVRVCLFAFDLLYLNGEVRCTGFLILILVMIFAAIVAYAIRRAASALTGTLQCCSRRI